MQPRWRVVCTGGGHSRAVQLQAAAEAEPALPGGLPAAHRHPAAGGVLQQQRSWTLLLCHAQHCHFKLRLQVADCLIPSSGQTALHSILQAHDSIEDARTALALHTAYKRLAADGPEKLRAGLTRMYDWGNTVGWEPAAWSQSPPDI